MNGRIKIYSKANMLDQYSKMSLVLIITVLLSLVFNNSYILGEFIMKKVQLDSVISFIPGFAVKTLFFTLLGFLSYIFLMPFSFGRDIWFYENAKKNRQKLKNLFSFYKSGRIFPSIKFLFLLRLKKFFITFLFMIPALTLGGYLVYSLNEGTGRKMLTVIVLSIILLAGCAAFFSFVFSQRYFLAQYIFYENDFCRVKDAVKLSCAVMENRCFETAMLKLSFIGWIALCVFVFPAGYVYPYYKISISIKAISLLVNTKATSENNT